MRGWRYLVATGLTVGGVVLAVCACQSSDIGLGIFSGLWLFMGAMWFSLGLKGAVE